MEKRLIKTQAVVAIIVLLIFTSRVSVRGGEKRVLIVSQSSDFKNEVVGSLQEELDDSSINFTVKDISALRKVNEDEWDAIVIVHAVKMGRIKSSVKRYLDSVNDWEKVIVLTTYGSEDPVPGMYGIDSISAASEEEPVKPVIADLKARLKAILYHETDD
jgi:hypothetical protein